MSNGLKLLLLAAGTMITCILCVVAFAITKSGKAQVGQSTVDSQSLYSFDELEEYNGQVISGSALTSLMKQYESATVYFLVKTKECEASQGVYYNRDESGTVIGMYSKEQSTLNEDYINELGSFLCSVVQNENGVVIGLTFIQR